MTQLMQRKLSQIENMLDAGLDVQSTSRVLALLGWNLSEPNILDEISVVDDPISQATPTLTSHKYLHFLWHAFDKLPISLITPFATSLRQVIAKKHFKACGDNLTACKNISLISGQEIEIGSNVTICEGVSLDGRGGLTVEDSAYIGEHVFVLSQTVASVNANKVKIGKAAHIEPRATIFPGVSIGAGAIITCGSIVTSDVPAHSIASGVPARIIEPDIELHDKAA